MGTPVVANITFGPAVVWYAPVGEAVPDETTVDFGTAWGGNWDRLGFTQSPVAALYEFELTEADVQELLTTPKRWKNAESLALEVAVSEIAGEYFQLGVAAGTLNTTAAGASQKGYEELQVGGERIMDEYTFGIEGMHIDANGNVHPIRYFVHKANPKINGALEYQKADNPGIPLQILALADYSKSAGNQLFVWQRVTAPAS